jgi:putative copper export protein
MAQLMAALTGWIFFLALVGATGSVAARWLVLPRVPVPEGSDEPMIRGWVARFGRGAGSLLVLAMALVLVRQVREFRDPFVPWAEDAGLLLSTSWGTWWELAAAASLAVAVAFSFAAAGRGAGSWLATPLVLGVAAFPGLTGHASGGDSPTWITLPADILHVLAAGAWMGTLAVMLYLEYRWRRWSDTDDGAGRPASLLPALIPAFSPVAVAGVATLIVTGVVASWVHLESPGALLSTGYGRVLVAKLGVVVLVLILGALNWKRITLLLVHEEGPHRMRRTAGLELALGAVVLLLTAILVRTSPLGH